MPGPDLLIGILSSLLLFIFLFFKNGHLELFTSSIILPLIGLLVLMILNFIKHKKLFREFHHTLRLWGSLIIMIFVYENLRSGIDQTHMYLIDDSLMKIDLMIFGVVPSIWLQHWYHPILVDIMSVFYALYFLIPCSVLFLLYIQGHIREFKITATSMVITLALGYIGYIIFPASPPRFSPLLTFTNPVELRGIFIFNAAQNMWDKASTAASFCAFPSLHVGLSSIGAFWGIKYRNLLPQKIMVVSFLILTTVLLWFSTLYLRHHWFADIIAGWIVAGIASLLGYFLSYLWEKNTEFKESQIEVCPSPE